MAPRLVIALAVAALTLTACTSTQTSPESARPSAESTTSDVSVIVTTTMLGDVVGQIVECGGGSTTVLMPAGTDPHDFSASSEQIAALITADLVVANGLGLEAGLSDAFASAAADGARILEVAPLLTPIEFGAHSGEAGPDHGDLDPHFWFDMTRMATAAELIGAELASTTGNDAYTSCAATTAAAILEAEAEVRASMESVPVDRRILVTDHEALGYLADAYGFEIAGTVIPSGTTLAEPSSADLARLVGAIKAAGVTAIFANVAQNSRLADAVAAEAGSEVTIIPLYVESLGAPDSPAATYIDMMKANARLIATGLKG